MQVLAVFSNGVEISPSSPSPPHHTVTHSDVLRWKLLDGRLTPRVSTSRSLV